MYLWGIRIYCWKRDSFQGFQHHGWCNHGPLQGDILISVLLAWILYLLSLKLEQVWPPKEDQVCRYELLLIKSLRDVQYMSFEVSCVKVLDSLQSNGSIMLTTLGTDSERGIAWVLDLSKPFVMVVILGGSTSYSQAGWQTTSKISSHATRWSELRIRQNEKLFFAS